MKRDRNIIYALIVSLFLHIIMISFIFGFQERKSKTKKITWVSITSTNLSTVGNKSVTGNKKGSPTTTQERKQKETKRKELRKKKKEQKTIKEKRKFKTEKKNKTKKENKLKNKTAKKTRKKTKKQRKQKARRFKSQEKNKISESSGTKGNSETNREKRENQNSAPQTDEIDQKLAELYQKYVGEGTGEGGVSTEEVKLKYAETISNLVKNNYKLPPAFKNLRLTCIVYLHISKGGEIKEIRLKESSGNQSFDSFVLKSIQESAPFPPPPTEIKFLLRFSTYD